MKRRTISRRDFLKIVGATALSAPVVSLGHSLGFQQVPENRIQPNFIILVFDTLSADHMSLYGYARETTPQIKRFAEKSNVYHLHRAAGNFTKPNVASLLTGVLPWSHRAFELNSLTLENYVDSNIFSCFKAQQYSTIALTHNTLVNQVLNEFKPHIDILTPPQELVVYDPNDLANAFANDYPLGFYAAKRWRDGYAGPSNSLFINPLTNLSGTISAAQINETNKDRYPLGLNETAEGYLYKLEDAIDWIGRSAISSRRPFLAYFHLLPPHEAYRPRADYVDLFAGDGQRLTPKPPSRFSQHIPSGELNQLAERYDEYVAFVDSEFGRLYEILDREGLLETTYLILTSDHGQLFERGIHGHNTPTLYKPLLHIPLLIHSPGQTQRKDILSPTSIIDLMPTMMSLTHQDIPDWCEGRILPELGPVDARDRPLFAVEAKRNPVLRPLRTATLSILHWPYKLISYRGYPGYVDIDRLFDLGDDPEELDDLASVRPGLVKELRDALEQNRSAAERRSIGAF